MTDTQEQCDNGCWFAAMLSWEIMACFCADSPPDTAHLRVSAEGAAPIAGAEEVCHAERLLAVLHDGNVRRDLRHAVPPASLSVAVRRLLRVRTADTLRCDILCNRRHAIAEL